jgi:hypothetical protein
MNMFKLLRLGFFPSSECGHNRWIKQENLEYFFFTERGLVAAFWVLKLAIETDEHFVCPEMLQHHWRRSMARSRALAPLKAQSLGVISL